MSSIHAHEHPIRQIFSNEFAFKIPLYQRPYSWDTKQTGELLSDLLAASEGFTPESPKEKKEIAPYFLGSIVLIKAEGIPDADVIDGQQRLTTLALLLSALRVSFDDAKRRHTFASLIFEEGDSLVGTKARCRLMLRERDHDFFEKNILRHVTLDQLPNMMKLSIPDPQHKLVENTQYLLEKVQGLPTLRRDALAAFLLQQTYLVVVSTHNLDSAFRIFSVLNNRGMDLTVADILKAEIIGKIDKEEQETFVKLWEDAEQELGTTHFAELFSNIRMIRGRSKLRKTILEGFRESVPLFKDSKRFIQEELIPSADSFAIIIGNDYESSDRQADKRINKLLRLLSRLDDTDWMPPTIYFLTLHGNDPVKVESFLTDLDRLASVMWLLRKDVNDRITRYARILEEIEDGSVLGNATSPLQLTDDEQKKAITVIDGDTYNLTPKMKRTMLLLRIDEALSSGEASYSYETMTVEHILPQTPAESSEWCEWWPDAKQRESDLHKIGNLALLNRRQNAAASNWPFAKKKDKYFRGKSGSSPFAITTEVIAKNHWKPDDFKDRQQRFIEILMNLWRLKR